MLATMSRLDDFHDAVNRHGSAEAALDHLIPSGTTSVPFRSAGYLKTERSGPGLAAHREAVAKGVHAPADLVQVDPRLLQSTQPGVTRAGVAHYLNDRQWESGGATYADQGNAGNAYPTVYRRSRDNAHLLLGGHHRATAALMRGETLPARVIEGP